MLVPCVPQVGCVGLHRTSAGLGTKRLKVLVGHQRFEPTVVMVLVIEKRLNVAMGGGRFGRGVQVGQFGVGGGGGGAQAPVTPLALPLVRARARVRARVRVRLRRVRGRVRSRLRVGVGKRVKVGFKCSVGVLHQLGGEGCYVGKGNEEKFSSAFRATICMAGSY